jgi:hypothetical protein
MMKFVCQLLFILVSCGIDSIRLPHLPFAAPGVGWGARFSVVSLADFSRPVTTRQFTSATLA